jgi:hypothetical protein
MQSRRACMSRRCLAQPRMFVLGIQAQDLNVVLRTRGAAAGETVRQQTTMIERGRSMHRVTLTVMVRRSDRRAVWSR